MDGILLQVGAVTLAAISTGVGLAAFSYRRGKSLGKLEMTHVVDACKLECSKTISQVGTAVELTAQTSRYNTKRLDEGSERFREVSTKLEEVKTELHQGNEKIVERLIKLETAINGGKK